MRTTIPLFLLLLAACGSADAPVATDTDTDTVDTDAAPWPPVRFAFPVDPRSAIADVVGVDHDPATGDGLAARALCRNYRGDGFPACYDQHDGSDFLLRGGFAAMDAGSATVLAGADGEVVEVDDTHYDRCHASIETGDVTCDTDDDGQLRPIVPNEIVVEHVGGVRTLYYHLKQGSALVTVGDVVVQGQPLALIGSSGRSSLPHLHFEVHDADGAVVDPYAGPWSQDETWWCEQEHGDGLPGPCP
jgi:hypothetical protein